MGFHATLEHRDGAEIPMQNHNRVHLQPAFTLHLERHFLKFWPVGGMVSG
jgi:hypothetical protein